MERVKDRPVDPGILTQKLEQILRDPDLNLVLGSYLAQVIIPTEVKNGHLTEEQGTRLLDACFETLDTLLTPEERKSVAEEVRRAVARNKISPFAGF